MKHFPARNHGAPDTFFGPTPPVPGIDVAGTVAEGGPGADSPPPGRRVVLNAAVTCDKCIHCTTGDHGTCRSRRALGQAIDGGYAEYVVVPAANVHPIGDNVSFEQAAAIPSNYFTAWQMLFLRARACPGDTILIAGAAGGVGSALVKIAVASGMRVIGTVGSAAKAKAVRDWGADTAFSYGDPAMAEATMEATAGSGVDAVLDTVGAAMWNDLLPVLRAGG